MKLSRTVFPLTKSLLILQLAFAAHVTGEPPAAKPAPVIELGLLFRDNAVLQQQIRLPVWGIAKPVAKVTVTFDTQTKITTADEHGVWRVMLEPLTADKLTSVTEAPKGRSLTVVAELEGEKIAKTITNVLIGEVWLCAGQSNMGGKLGGAHQTNFPALRQLVADTNSTWVICRPETTPGFKKVCFYFARRLQQDIKVPVGIINAAVGGSNIESWLNTGGNYQKQIAPLVGYGIRGAVWYQGESNEKDGRGYLPKLHSLIFGWREVWRQGDFPFYFVQLPGIGTSPTNNPAGGDGRAEIRQAQFEALAITNTGMAVCLDIGAVKEHPPNKYDTGVRLAHLALHRQYGFKDLVPSGPVYKSHRVEGDKVRITFEYAGNGLMLAEKKGAQPPVETLDAELNWLSIRGKDGVWHWADGKIEGAELVVSCNDVKEPDAVRYAYTTRPVGSLLYNKDGLPAAPFTTCGY